MSCISRFRNSLFCGKKRQRVADMVEAPDRPAAGKFPRPAAAPRTCNHCLTLCDEIHSEVLGVQLAGPGSPGLTAPELSASGASQAGVVVAGRLHARAWPCGSMAAAEASQGHMELSPSPIAEAFGLGTPTGPLVAIASGPSAVHRSWRLSTSRGRFAVKAFNRDPHARGLAALEGPVRLELAALAAGVPLPRPLLAVATGAGVAEVAGLGPQPVLVRVHEWVDGTAPAAPASTRLAGQLGGVLATIHRLGVPCGQSAQVDRWYRAVHGAEHWRGLAACAERAGRGWAGRLRAALPLVAEVEALVAARAAEAMPLVVTHSDLVPGNVLVSAEGRPWIIDWDDAGPWNAAEEVAAAVVSWSSRARGEPDARVALALVEGYRRAGGVLGGHSPTVLAGSLSAVANWLELNVRRSLDLAADQAVRWQAEAEVTGALIELPRRLARLDRWAELLG